MMVAVAIAVFVELDAVWEKINPQFVAKKENFMGKREDETEKASEGQQPLGIQAMVEETKGTLLQYGITTNENIKTQKSTGNNTVSNFSEENVTEREGDFLAVYQLEFLE